MDRADRTAVHLRSGARRGGADSHLGDGCSGRSGVAVEDRRASWSRCVAGRGSSLGGRRRPTRVGGRPGRCRQDPDARRRRQRPARPRVAPCSVSPRRRKRPGYSNGTPGCAPTPSPNCSTSGSAPTGRHCPSTGSAAGRRVVVDEAGMVSTPALHQLVDLAEANHWRLVLVGDHRQLQAVGRGGLFAELCANGRVDELERLHRFTHTTGRLPRRCNCDPVIPAPSTPTRPTTGSSPAPSTITSPPSPTRGSNTTPARRHRRPRRLHQRSCRRHQPRRPSRPSRRRTRSTRTSPRRSPAESAPTSVTSSPPAATTAPSSRRPASRSATGRPGPSRRSATMVR